LKHWISIHAPREGSDQENQDRERQAEISIHAPREGSDHCWLIRLFAVLAISIHAPREGSDLVWEHWENLMGQFLSTLPARGATLRGGAVAQEIGPFLSTLPARGATDTYEIIQSHKEISIHAPREGSDFLLPSTSISTSYFYPRSPRGERRRRPRKKR